MWKQIKRAVTLLGVGGGLILYVYFAAIVLDVTQDAAINAEYHRVYASSTKQRGW